MAAPARARKLQGASSPARQALAWAQLYCEWLTRFAPHHAPDEAARLAREETTRELGDHGPPTAAAEPDHPELPDDTAAPVELPHALLPPMDWSRRVPLPPPHAPRTGPMPHPLDREPHRG